MFGDSMMSSSPLAPGQQLVGRSVETETLLGLLDRAQDGLGATAFIQGEAGIGKTLLLDMVSDRARARGFQVLQGTSSELERDRPFGALAQAFEIGHRSPDPERAEIARLLFEEGAEGGPHAPGPVEVRFRLVEAFVSLAERLALAGPVLVTVEDLHWADPSTLLALDHLGRRLADVPLVLLGTLRPSSPSTELARVVDGLVGRGGPLLVLGPLDEAAVAALVEEIAGARPGPGLLGTTAGAAGNPLLVKELVRALGAEGALRLAGGVADVGERVIPPSFRFLVLRQLSTLAEPTLHVLRVASVLGTSFSVGDLATVLGRPAAQLLQPVDEALRAGILGEAGEHLAFRHELVREAVYLDLLPAVRRGLHLQAGRSLAAGGGPALQVAAHLSRGAAPGDVDAAGWLWRAAREAAPRAPAVAVELLERTLGLIPATYPHRDAVAAELVEALLWSGQLTAAVTRVHELLARDTDSRRKNAVRLSLLRALLFGGWVAEASQEIQPALDSFEGDDRERLALDIQAALVRLFSGDAAAAREGAEDALAQAEWLRDDPLRQQAYSVIGLAAFLVGAIPQAIDAIRRGLEQAGPLSIASYGFEPHFFLGTALIEVDRLADADQVLREGQRIAEELGLAWQSSHYHSQIGLLQRMAAGRWDDAIAELETALVAWQETGVPATFAQALMAVIAVHRGSLEVAAGYVARAEQDVASGARFGVDVAMWASALLKEANGDGLGALSTLEAAWQLNRLLGFRSQYVRLGVDLTRLAMAADRSELATSVAAAMEEAATLNQAPSWKGAALVCRGLADGEAHALRMAVQSYRDSPRPAELAWACLEAGLGLATTGNREEGIVLLEEALEGCAKLGAHRDVARAEAALRGLGVRRGRRGPRRRPSAGWESLTPTELAIVQLVVEGLTNAQIGQRLFISPRTVESHLTHVFSKVSVSSKLQLAAEAARRLTAQADPPPVAQKAP